MSSTSSTCVFSTNNCQNRSGSFNVAMFPSCKCHSLPLLHLSEVTCSCGLMCVSLRACVCVSVCVLCVVCVCVCVCVLFCVFVRIEFCLSQDLNFPVLV